MRSLLEITKSNHQLYLSQIIEIEKNSFITPWSYNSFVQELENPLSCLWGLVDEEILYGYTCFWIFDKKIQVLNIAIHSENRGKDLGKYILSKIIDRAVSERIEDIWLEVRVSNTPARKLYQKLGFMEMGRRPRYYRDTNEDAIIMNLSVRPMNEQFPFTKKTIFA